MVGQFWNSKGRIEDDRRDQLLGNANELDEDDQLAAAGGGGHLGRDVPAEVLRNAHQRIDAAERGDEEDMPAEDVLADLRARFS